MREAPFLLFAPAATREYAERISRAAGIALSEHEEREFEDGEHKIRSLVNVRNRDVFVIHSLYTQPGASVNDKLCRLLFFIGSLKDAAAASVTAVVPYLCYARKDRKTQPRDPVTTRYVARLFEAAGVDRVVTIDVHNLMAYQNAFRCATEHLEAAPLFVEHFADGLAGMEIAVVSPDPGGVKRAQRFGELLSRRVQRPVSSAFVEKHREAGVVSGEALIGDVRGRAAIILDDMIATGGTLARAARACREHGAARVYAAATHGLFVGKSQTLIQEAALERIVVTDTVPPFRLDAGVVGSKVLVLDSAPFLAEAIRRIHAGDSLVALTESWAAATRSA